MPMTQINTASDTPKGPSKLETAAKVLGILGSLAQTGMGAYGTFVNDPRKIEALKQAKDLGTGVSNVLD